MSQCPSCGGDCGYGPLRHCQQGINHETDFRTNVCTSDEWLANATQSTRDLANKIKSQQFKGTGNQLRNETDEEVRAREIGELKERNHELESQMQGLSNEINGFQNTIERQRHVMRRVMDAWDTTTHQKNADGRFWQCMEELRMEITK